MTKLIPRLVLAALGRTARLALDLVLPPRCLSCGTLTGTMGGLCPACWNRMVFLGPPWCRSCGHPFEADPGPAAVCGICAGKPRQFGRARAVLRYDDASKPLVLGFKHADKTALAPHFARWMARAGADLLAEADLIVPVPLHRWRLFHRRYNQAALLAGALSRSSGVPWAAEALLRVRRTRPQGTMGRLQRHRNVQGAFTINDPSSLAGRRVLLVDDVLTTGATIDECARILLRGGARSVDVLTFARVVLAHG